MTDEFLEQHDLETEAEKWEAEIKLRNGKARGLKRAFYVVFWIAMFVTAMILDAIFFPHPYLNAWEYFFG